MKKLVAILKSIDETFKKIFDNETAITLHSELV